jgi:Protein kinase domain/WD40-like Beta Propeller Repeat
MARIIHRDLKPGNIIVTEERSIKVLDFGLAKQLGRPGVEQSDGGIRANGGLSTNSTLWGHVAGTVSYMSPEQADGAKVDERSDIFSFGCVLFEMITGKKAFSGADINETLAKIRRVEHPSIHGLRSDLPYEIEKVIAACIELDPKSRPQTAKEVAGILRAVRTQVQERAKRIKQFALVLATILLSGTAWLGYRKFGSRPPVPDAALQALPLTGDAASEFTPSISPDGAAVAFAVESSQSGIRHLAVKSLSGGELKALTNGTNDDVNPVWSPSGRENAFRRTAESGKTELWTVSLGGSQQKLTDLSPIVDLVTQQAVCWPDENWLIISRQVSPGGPSSLYSLDTATGAETRITEPPNETEGDFSPEVSWDRHFLAFVRIATWNSSALYVLPLTDTRRQPARRSSLTRENCGRLLLPGPNRAENSFLERDSLITAYGESPSAPERRHKD